MRAHARPVAITTGQEVHLIDGEKDLRHRHLQELVLQHRYAQWAHLALTLGMYLRRTSLARYALRLSRPTSSSKFLSRSFSYASNVTPSTPLAASFLKRKKHRRSTSSFSHRYNPPNRCRLFVDAFSAMAGRKVGQSCSIFRMGLVSCAGCVALLAPSPESAPTARGCPWILLTNPTPERSGGTPIRCAVFPAWSS